MVEPRSLARAVLLVNPRLVTDDSVRLRIGVLAWKKPCAFLAVMCICMAVDAAEVAIDQDLPARGFYSLRPAPRWEEGLLIGNGHMGGVIHGKPGEWIVSLTHEHIGIPDHKAGPPPDLSDILPGIRRLIREGKRNEAAELAWNKSKDIAERQGTQTPRKGGRRLGNGNAPIVRGKTGDIHVRVPRAGAVAMAA